MEQRVSRVLERLPASLLEGELARWLALGMVPEPDPARVELVGELWGSPLFRVLLGAIGFWPPDDLDLGPYLARPYATLAEFGQARVALQGLCARGALARGELAYWQLALQLQAPQLYLEPYLPVGGPLEGCDLACGWGRICLALPEYAQRLIWACDLAPGSLRHLERLARRRGLQEVIKTCQADVTRLPFPAERFDFWLAFDIFEHLSDPVLDRCLAEALRCSRPGAVMYAEIPLQAWCPALTHVQSWTADQVRARFAAAGWETILWSPFAPEHFTFRARDRRA